MKAGDEPLSGPRFPRAEPEDVLRYLASSEAGTAK
jgi:hypothetical protein